MSDFYKMRKELQAAGRSKEKEMRDIAVRAVTTPVRTVGSNIAEDFRGALSSTKLLKKSFLDLEILCCQGETAEDIGYGTP